jgi:hypothetical protein
MVNTSPALEHAPRSRQRNEIRAIPLRLEEGGDLFLGLAILVRNGESTICLVCEGCEFDGINGISGMPRDA